MRLRELVNCHGCLRATRGWSYVKVTSDGRERLSYALCFACRSEVEDAVRHRIKETRGAAVVSW